MSQIEIRSFREIVLFELQNRLFAGEPTELTFQSAWILVVQSSFFFVRPRVTYAQALLETLRGLAAEGLIQTFGDSVAVERFSLTISGQRELEETTFMRATTARGTR
jgi:hypothetical protein